MSDNIGYIDIFGLIVLIATIYLYGFRFGIIVFVFFVALGMVAGLVTEYATDIQSYIFIVIVLIVGVLLNYPPTKTRIISFLKKTFNKN